MGIDNNQATIMTCPVNMCNNVFEKFDAAYMATEGTMKPIKGPQ